ncbi:RacP protein [Streptomyces sp. NBC_01803]|uniref:RacP protein n=1 Tax=Streptomyces sp. NBC_01803 TaxID=2975946 RepID=UPI002DDC21AC|nr:RacP protein [Streptomyces sp. NBC_01803]WSA42737.1 RacP protein [Streptomyces sp. NBC_01803]
MPRASRRRGEAARRHADTVRFVLFEARPAGLTFPQLVRATELTPSQVRSGLACLRDVIAERGWPPLVHTRADGYRFTGDKTELEEYERAVIREKLTQIRRLITGTVAPHAALHPGDRWVRHLVAQLNSIESTLDVMLAER